MDYGKLTEIMKDAYGNEPVEITIMEKKIIKIYPGGKIFPGKSTMWIQGVNIATQKKKILDKDLDITKKVGEKKAW